MYRLWTVEWESLDLIYEKRLESIQMMQIKDSDKFLMKTFPKLGKSMMYKAIRNKKIKVNRKRCTFDQKIQENDSILLKRV